MKTIYAYVCGDLLHYGHILHFKKAKELGDYVYVGVLTQEAIMEKKPAPILSYTERVQVIQAIKYIDEVITQETYSPITNILKLKPDIVMESASHKKEDIEEVTRIVEGYGGKVIVNPYYEGLSSTKIKKRVKKMKQETNKRSALKSLIWRITGVIILGTITYAYTRKWIQTTAITFLHHSIFLFVFWGHERLWLKLKRPVNSTLRKIAKMFTYETVLGNVVLATITYLVTGSLKTMTAITVTYIGLKHIIFVINEFLWDRIKWGKN